jgi:hypothetical protein
MSALNKNLKAEQLFSKLWGAHTKITPSAVKMRDLFKEKKHDNLKIDHISFRSVGYKETGLNRFENVFKKYDYEVKGEYKFSDKRMDAIHLEPKDGDSKLPKVCVSQFNIDESPGWVQENILSCLGSCTNYNPNALLEWGAPWDKSFSQYQKISNYSEYVGWFYAHGFVPDHFSISVNSLNKFHGIYDVNYFIQDNGFDLNLDDGSVKRDKAGRLYQSSTLADIVPVVFDDPNHLHGKVEYDIPGGFTELAQRGFEKNSKFFHGFISESCEKLMTSTHRDKSHSDFEKKNSLAINSVVRQIEHEAKDKELLDAESINFVKN